MLNSPPGTLTSLVNAHITPGGEIEKRKQFSFTALPTNSYGLESTDSGLVVFGSVAEGSLNASLPSGVTYQRLQHPDGSTAMTAVNHSCVFDGKAFVIATFGSGGTFAFYDGALVYDFFAGRAASWLTTNQGLANHLAALINQSADFSSSSATLVSGSTYKIVVDSPSGISTEPTVTDAAASGTLSATTSRTHVDGITGVSAQGQFTIQAGYEGAGSQFTSILVGTSELLGAAVNYTTNNDTTAAAVKDAINGRQTTVAATTLRARAANVATLTIGAHAFIVGDIVTVAGVGGTGYNGSVTITAKTGTTISYANTGSNEGATADVGGTVTMGTRLYTATVNANVVQIVASATGTAANDKVVAVTSAANAAGGICVDSYSFTLAQNSNTGAAVPTITAIYINGVQLLGATATGADTNAVVADAAAKVIASATTGYTAVASGNTLHISRLAPTSSSLPLSVVVIVDANGGVVTGPLDTLVVTPGPSNLTQFSPASVVTNFVAALSYFVNASGGTPPYTYKWEVGSGFTAGSPTTPTTPTNGVAKLEFLGASGSVDDAVRAPLVKITRASAGTSLQRIYDGTIKVTVTDSNLTKPKLATAELPVTFKFYPYA